jgi:hypothetical protein
MHGYKRRTVSLSLAACIVFATSASATGPGDNKDENKCMATMSKGLAKSFGGREKCLVKCRGLLRKGLVSASDCMFPYGGATLSCIDDPVKGTEAKAIATIGKGCTVDCPECYDGGNCTAEIGSRVTNIGFALDFVAGPIWCDDSGSGDGLTAGEAKCQDTVGKTVAKVVAAKSKCYDKCVSNQFKGVVPPGACEPPATDGPTQTCVASAESKAATTIDKRCSLIGQSPECYGLFVDGAFWVNTVGMVENVPETYCGSPSGAFLD